MLCARYRSCSSDIVHECNVNLAVTENLHQLISCLSLKGKGSKKHICAIPSFYCLVILSDKICSVAWLYVGKVLFVSIRILLHPSYLPYTRTLTTELLLSKPKYIQDLLQKSGMSFCRPIATLSTTFNSR